MFRALAGAAIKGAATGLGAVVVAELGTNAFKALVEAEIQLVIKSTEVKILEMKIQQRLEDLKALRG